MLSIDVKVRKAKLKDVPGITKLWQELIACHRKRCMYTGPIFAYKKNELSIYRKYITKCIRSRNHLVLVAEHDGAPVGYVNSAVAKLGGILLHDKEVHVNGIFIKAGYRRKGIGTKFFAEIAKWGKRKKVFSIGLMCSVPNKDAFKSYRKLGFFEHHFKMSKII